MKQFLLVAMAALVCAGQSLTLSASRQPDEVFRASYLNRVRGVALYEVLICNADVAGERTVSQGLLIQRVNAHVATVNLRLAETTLRSARNRSPLFIGARILEWTAWTAGGLIGGGVIGSGVRNALIPSMTAAAAHRLADEFDQQGTAVSIENFCDPAKDLRLPARSCGACMLLGNKAGKASFTESLP